MQSFAEKKAELRELLSAHPHFLKTQQSLSLLGNRCLDLHLWVTSFLLAVEDKTIHERLEEFHHNEEAKQEWIDLQSEKSKEKAQKKQNDQKLEAIEETQEVQAPKPQPAPKLIKLEPYVRQLEDYLMRIETELQKNKEVLKLLNEDAVRKLDETKKEVDLALKEANINISSDKIKNLDRTLEKIQANEKQGISDHSRVLQGPRPSLDNKKQDPEEEKLITELSKDSPLRKACQKLLDCKKELEKQYNDLFDIFAPKEIQRQDIEQTKREGIIKQDWILKLLAPELQRRASKAAEEEKEEKEEDSEHSFGPRPT